jgi:hypothetical protein
VECDCVELRLNWGERRWFDMCLVERNVAGLGHGLISVNTGVLMCDLWRGMGQGGVMASLVWIQVF